MNSDILERYEPVIGLEIHMQLNTKTKMFSPERNRFGDEPNTNIGFVDIAIPGALPVINKEAVKKAILFGLAVESEVQLISQFDRKSYFYPDNPANYQITQFFQPLLIGGKITTTVDGNVKTFTIEHTHLENDAGKLLHFSHFAGVDYNRAGTPLIEIVSDPCIHSPRQASCYAHAILAIGEYLDINDGNLQEGSMRMDANVSLRKRGEKVLRPKAEIKNLNSFHNLEMAIEAEIQRQAKFYDEHPDGVIVSGTYRFLVEERKTILMRKKESADDYRYFPEPDLPPLHVTKDWIDEIRKELPELPAAKFTRYTEILGLSAYNAEVLINNKKLCSWYEKGLETAINPVSFCNWLTVEFMGRAKEKDKDLDQLGIHPTHIADLSNAIEKKHITGKMAKEIADIMVDKPHTSPLDLIQKDPRFTPMADQKQLESIVDHVLKEHAGSVADYKNGKDRAFQFLVGMVMKQTKGKGDPEMVRDLLSEKLEKM